MKRGKARYIVWNLNFYDKKSGIPGGCFDSLLFSDKQGLYALDEILAIYHQLIRVNAQFFASV